MPYAIIIFGANGPEATSIVYPVIWELYQSERLPKKLIICGFGTVDLLVDQLKNLCNIKVENNKLDTLKSFWTKNYYVKGSFTSIADYHSLNLALINFLGTPISKRLFFLAVPNTYYSDIFMNIHATCNQGGLRIILPKPFSDNAESFKILQNSILNHIGDYQIYFFDTYFDKEIKENILSVRFENRIVHSSWNGKDISNVKILVGETGLTSNEKFFDNIGIVKNVMLHYLMHLLSIVAMDKPNSLSAEDIICEKIRLLKCVDPIAPDNIIIGQYIGHSDKTTYRKQIGVDSKSITPTYAQVIINISSENWNGVPFILICGKGLAEAKTEVQVMYKPMIRDLYGKGKPNSIVVSNVGALPQTKLSMSVNSATVSFPLEDVDLVYKSENEFSNLQAQYLNTIIDAMNDVRSNCYSCEEVQEHYRIFDEVLKSIDNGEIELLSYMYGSLGPEKALTQILDIQGIVQN